MTVFAIGDVQGCFEALQRLLHEIKFDRLHDRLWFAGDLVNRGPKSLETLRFVRSLGDRATVVLGNHDLHLLSLAAGAAPLRSCDTLTAILDAPDRTDLLDWLRAQPLVHRDLGFVMVHAGLSPSWSEDEAERLAREVERALAMPQGPEFFRALYGSTPDRWEEGLTGMERLRVIVNTMTRLRYCSPEGRMDFREKGPPGTQNGLLPWFELETPRREPTLFGHWSALGAGARKGAFSLDSGCVWGGALTALRLDDLRFFSVRCRPEAGRDDG